jgi:hypothetical protein
MLFKNSTFAIHSLKIVSIMTSLGIAAQGAILFSDDFESYSPNSNIGTDTWTLSTGVASYMTVRNQTTATPFGTPNQYAQLADTGTASSPVAQFIRLMSPQLGGTYNTVTTLQFDFYEPTGGGDQAMRFGFAGFDGTRLDLNAGGNRAFASLNNGSIGGVSGGNNTSYSLDTAYTFFMILNDTAASVNYAGGSITAFTAHVWYEALGSGAPVFAGSIAAANAQNTSGYGIGFRTFNADLQEAWIDNVVVFEGAAAIPEPTTALLGGLGMLALLRRRR